MTDPSKEIESERRRLAYSVGHIIMMWGNVEMVLGHCLADVLNINRGVANLLLAGASARRRIEHLQSMIKKRVLDLGEDTLLFEETLKQIFVMEDQRNIAAHSAWVSYDDDGELARVRFSREHDGRNLNYHSDSPETYAATGDKLGRCIRTLAEIWDRRFPERIPLLRIPELPSAEGSDDHTQPDTGPSLQTPPSGV